jgi:hypothetical protein
MLQLLAAVNRVLPLANVADTHGSEDLLAAVRLESLKRFRAWKENA